MISIAWRYNHAMLPLIGASIVALTTAAVLWRRRRQEGALPLMVLVVGAAIWAFGEAAEMGCLNLIPKIGWAKFRYLGIVTIPVAWLVFALLFSQNRRWVTRRNVAVVSILPVVNISIVWTNGWHHLIWQRTWLHTEGALTVMASERGYWYWVVVFYAYVFILAGTVLLVPAAIRSHRTYRHQTVLLLCGILAPLATNAVFQLRLSPIPYQDLTPMSFAFASVVLTWNFLRHGLLFPPMPVARDQVVQSMKDGVLVLDLEQRILDLNQAFLDMLGRPAKELLGHGMDEFLTLPDAPADFSPSAPEYVDVTIRLDQNISRQYEMSRSPLRTKWAGVVGSVVMLRDVTKRKLAELQHRRLFTAIEQAAEEVMITDREGAIVYVNPAFERITGYARQEAVGKNPRILKSGAHDDAFYQGMWQTLTEGRIWQGTLTNRRRDGTHMQQEATISPIFGDDGVHVGYVSVKRDVTEQLELQALLRRSQKMEAVGQLAGGIAHDFNNLLVPIIGYADLLMETLDPDDARCDDLNEVLGAAKRARRLTRQLLAFSRKQILELGPVDINQVVGDFMMMLRRTTREDIDFDLLFGASVSPVWADVSQVEQVLMNLVVNAQDAMPQGGKLSVRTKEVDAEEIRPHGGAAVKPGKYVLLAVSDTGVGIPQDAMEHIFEPFFTTKGDEGGTGLGLATVHGIVQQHEGAIAITSQPNEGTTVAVYLPVKVAAARVSAPDDSVMADVEHATNEKILVVEDESSVRRLVCALLEEQGYEVLSFADGRACLEALSGAGETASALVTDVIMPQMNGRELHEKLMLQMPDLPVLYMSGYADNVIADADLKDGHISFIQKPFSREEFVTKLQALLRGRRKPTHGLPG